MLRLYTAPTHLPEKTYVCQVLFGELLGIDCVVAPREGIAHYQLQLPNGAELVMEDHFWGHLPEGESLQAKHLPRKAVLLPHPFDPTETVFGIFGRPNFSQADSRMQCGLDLFASAFYMLTRWEEYVLPDRDAYGRFPAAAALAVRTGFIDRPVVNEYAALVWQMLVRLGWNQPRKAQRARLLLSHDVDHPRLWWSAAGRLRTLAGSLLARKNPRETLWWLRRHVWRANDPFDIFDAWMDFSETNGHVSHFNFLGERPRHSDCYYSLQHPFVRNLLKKITERGHQIGFHPSREAFADPLVFQTELDSLRRVAPQAVISGRHHYLCFAAPHTWQRWENAGLAWDSTLGYSEAEGFRCGICQEFPVFNFLTRQTLALREKPLAAMDITLAQYRGYTPEQGYARLQALFGQVKKHGGEFVLLWHNSSWNTYFWAPWQDVYTRFVRSC